jgi:hypothetical protein
MKYNFIIPYRNRKEHLDEFIKRFSDMLKDKDIDVQFYVVHQIHPGPFNRGAMNNIGFLEFCKVRPDGMFIFHDVDTYPTYWGSIPYEVEKGAFKRPVINSTPNNNLGLICTCWKEEYEKTNGFPNYWGWGSEDSSLYYRAKKLNIPIDESSKIRFTDTKYVINHEHFRGNQHFFAAQNGDIQKKEMQTGDTTNGLSDLDYQVLSSFELAPRFTILNVDFKLKSEQKS